jgi:hypothetical protein
MEAMDREVEEFISSRRRGRIIMMAVLCTLAVGVIAAVV